MAPHHFEMMDELTHCCRDEGVAANPDGLISFRRGNIFDHQRQGRKSDQRFYHARLTSEMVLINMYIRVSVAMRMKDDHEEDIQDAQEGDDDCNAVQEYRVEQEGVDDHPNNWEEPYAPCA